MRTTVVFLLILVLVAGIVALLNLGRLMYPIQLNLLFGLVQVPALLTFLLATLAVAALFALVSTLVSARASNQNAMYLRRIDDMRQALDKGENARFNTLTAVLDERVQRLEARIDALGTSVNQRVDRVRDELAADIAEVEHAILTHGDVPNRRL
jgi:hypothetical protein